jgi:hypothetical protein
MKRISSRAPRKRTRRRRGPPARSLRRAESLDRGFPPSIGKTHRTSLEREAEPKEKRESGSASTGGDEPCVAYIDTVEMFFRYLPRGLRTEVERVVGRRVRIEPCESEERLHGYRLIIQQPSRSCLMVLDRFQIKHRAKLCRVDLAFDFSALSRQWFERHALMRWRREGWMHDEENGFYYNATRRIEEQAGRRRAGRNIGVYADRLSKVTRKEVCHYELKFMNSASVRRQHWKKPSKLLQMNPGAVFMRHVKLVDFEPEHFIRRILRRNVKYDRIQYAGRVLTPSADRYWAARPRRVRHVIETITRNRVQLVKDLAPGYVARLKIIAYEVLSLPHQLSWLEDHPH